MKFALIHLGNDEVYGMNFVAYEIRAAGHEFQWVDGDADDAVDKVAEAKPDFICFSTLTVFFAPAVALARRIKARMPSVISVFGGVHVTSFADDITDSEVDIRVVGPARGTIEKIIAAKPGDIIDGDMPDLETMMASRREYYDTIPRIGSRHRKILMSHFGCQYNCSYCSTSRTREKFGPLNYKKFWLTRRPIEKVIEEAKSLLDYKTLEVTFGDDDILYGPEIDEWLPAFSAAWKKEIGLPIYGFATPKTVVKVSDNTLRVLADLVGSIAMGVQTARPELLKLFNRQFQDTAQVKAAFERLRSFGVPVRMDTIIGLPVEDPIGDAIDTIKLAQEVGGQKVFATAFPLMLYPGTKLYKWCMDNNIPLADECTFEFYTGFGSVKFDPDTAKKLRNLSRLAPFFIAYGVEERWIRTIIEMDLTEAASKAVSENVYLDSIVFRQGDKGREQFAEILKETALRY